MEVLPTTYGRRGGETELFPARPVKGLSKNVLVQMYYLPLVPVASSQIDLMK